MFPSTIALKGLSGNMPINTSLKDGAVLTLMLSIDPVFIPIPGSTTLAIAKATDTAIAVVNK